MYKNNIGDDIADQWNLINVEKSRRVFTITGAHAEHGHFLQLTLKYIFPIVYIFFFFLVYFPKKKSVILFCPNFTWNQKLKSKKFIFMRDRQKFLNVFSIMESSNLLHVDLLCINIFQFYSKIWQFRNKL